jgi:dihydrofolate synthase/folylpolyglutamate synthase
MITSFADVHRALAEYWQPGRPSGHGAKHRQSLDFMRHMLAYLGNPQDKLKVIHVAGTSGKTSTAYYVAALLKASGKKVGLTVSPHVDEVNERVQINMQSLPETEFCQAFDYFLKQIQAGGFTPNYFELFVAFAFCEFARQKADYAVVEVGIGGLLDSTNITTRADKVCVLTDIGMDHVAVLGNTLGEIAAQKAGIIQLQNVAFCYKQGEEIMDAFNARAARMYAQLNVLTAADQAAQYNTLPLFQQRNLGLAIKTVEYILGKEQKVLTDKAIDTAARTKIAGRLEIYKIGDKTLVLDVAHNPQKFISLISSMQERFGDKRVAALIAARAPTKRWSGNIQQLMTGTQHIVVTSVTGKLDSQSILLLCKAAGNVPCQIVLPAEDAFEVLMSRPEEVLLVCGSFRLLNHIRPII